MSVKTYYLPGDTASDPARRFFVCTTAAELPTVAPAAENDFGSAEDTDAFYRYNGAAWVVVGPGGAPGGAAGGVLSGTYPDPGFAVDMATQAELDAAVALRALKTTTITPTLPLTGGGDLSANRTLDVNNFGGDAGAGGTKGTVPAPAAGDAAAGKFLKADGTWTAPAAGTGISQVTANFLSSIHGL